METALVIGLVIVIIGVIAFFVIRAKKNKTTNPYSGRGGRPSEDRGNSEDDKYDR